MSDASTVTERTAGYLAGLEYGSLPEDVVSTLKALVLDTLGTALAAGTLGDGCRELVNFARQSGGASESSIIGFPGRYPAATAALVNGGLAHALNYDAVGAAHLGIVPMAPLAVAERLGKVSGREFLAALAAGCELSARLGSAIGGGHPTALLGQVLSYFGAAAADGRILRLTAEQMHSALGLAAMQAAGLRQVVIEGDPPAKAIYAAFPSHAGVLSALLAQDGLGAACDALDGEAGLPALVARSGAPRASMDAAFGYRFYLLSASFKPWPVSGHVMPFVEAALELAREHQLAPGEIARVVLTGNPTIRAWFEPPEKRRRPETSAAAANSVYFAVAKALVHGRLGLGDFTAEGLRDETALAFTDRMEHAFHESMEGGSVEILLRSGERHSRQVSTPLGHPSRPMDAGDLHTKFKDCARHAAWPIPSATLEQVIQAIEQLESLPDVGLIPPLLGPAAR
jgi:2-methylcitrate dehydratase PrpD